MTSSIFCPICLELIGEGDNTDNPGVQIRCGHIIHQLCLQSSLQTGLYDCPVCRKPLGEITTERKYLKYEKMLAIKLPRAAVEQRMRSEGISDADIASFFTGGASNEIGCFDQPNEPQYNFIKYSKMLKMGVPEVAVIQFMEIANIPIISINEFLINYSNELI